jgi:drug/metabolite transporter (DMT)-like permease
MALAVRVFAVFALAMMTGCIKLLDHEQVGLVESMFYRNLFAAPLILGYILTAPGTSGEGLASLKTAHFGAHVIRSCIGLFGMVLTFGAYRMLPLAEATTIGFTTPIFATILAATVLHEHVGMHRWSAVVIGFIGVLLVTRPGNGALPLTGSLVSLGSAFMIAVIAILLRQLGRTELPSTTAFWFCALSAIALGIVMLVGGFERAHNAYQWLLLIGLGVTGAAAQVALSASVRMAPVSTVITMDYTSLIWATLLGWSLFHVLPASSTWTGVPLIIGSGLYIAWREHQHGLKQVSA